MNNNSNRLELDAFELFFQNKSKGLSNIDSISNTASKLGLDKSVVWKWYDTNDWEDKESIRSVEVQKLVEERTNNSIAENKQKYLSILHEILEDYVNRDTPLKIRSFKDLDLVISKCSELQKVEDSKSNSILERKGEVVDEDYSELFDEGRMREILKEENESKKGGLPEQSILVL